MAKLRTPLTVPSPTADDGLSMIETQPDENSSPKLPVLEVRPKASLRYLGAAIGVIAVFPTLLSLITAPASSFRLDLAWFVLGGAKLAVVWLAYRWFTICARMDDESVQLRGLLRTLKFRLADFGEIRLEAAHAGSQAGRSVIYDRDQNRLGRIPDSMSICVDFEQITDRLMSIHPDVATDGVKS